MKLASEINPVLNKQYEAIGTCGMKKDQIVKGKLTSHDRQHDDAILEDSQGRVYAVSYKTLKEI